MFRRLHKLKALCLLPCILFSGCSSGHEKKAPALPSVATFEEFTEELFREYVASDSLSLHYTVLHPENLQIEKKAVSLGEFGKEALLASAVSAEEKLTRLYTYEKDKLDASGQLLYSLLEYALTNSILPEGTALYDSPLGPTTGLQTQLPILLAEYRFSSRSDVEDYFLLLSDLPRYFKDIAAFEQERAAAGTGSCAEVLSRILLQCKAFVENPGDNFLIVSFKDRLSSLPDLTATDIATLCIENQKLVFTKVLPAYEQLIETLSTLLDTSVPARGLCALPNGAAYYEYLVRSQTGSDRSVEELESMLESALQENMLTMLSLYESEALRQELKQYQEKGLTVQPDDSPLSLTNTEDSEPAATSQTNPEATHTATPSNADTAQTTASTSAHSIVLQQLQQQIQRDFPAPADAAFRVELIHPSLEDFISPALYLVPPLDAYKENVIYINHAKCATESLFSTLAHEGYPGHLYQNTYFASTSPHPLRMLLNFTGYDEGWGTYAELYSYEYANCSEELKQFLIAEQVAGLCLYSLSDIRIHYHGADLNTIVSFLGKYGFSAETAQEIFYTQLAEPVIYLPYSVGYLELCALREQYYEIKGTDALLLPFHTFLLETGPAPFSVLETLLNQNFR